MADELIPIGNVGNKKKLTDHTTYHAEVVDAQTPDGSNAALGTTTDTPAVATEDNTARTAISLLKGIKNSIYVSLLAILGATNGAAVVTDANGTLQQYLRGIVKLIAAIITVKIDQTTPGTTNKVAVLNPALALTHSAAVAVGVATTAVLATNADRKYAIIINDSDTTIYLGIGVDAVLNKGVRLNANGGSYEISAALGNLATGAINGISSVAGKNVLPSEGV